MERTDPGFDRVGKLTGDGTPMVSYVNAIITLIVVTLIIIYRQLLILLSKILCHHTNIISVLLVR